MSMARTRSGSARWGAIALLALTFAVGGLAGVAWERTRKPSLIPARDSLRFESRRGSRDSTQTRDFDGRRGRGGGGPRFPWFYDSLGLSDRQRASIDSIMRANRPRTDAIMSEVMPRLRAVSDSTRAAIDAVLTPEQLAKLKATPRYEFRRRGGPSGPRKDSMGRPESDREHQH